MNRLSIYLADGTFDGPITMTSPASSFTAIRVRREDMDQYVEDLNKPGIYFLLIGDDTVYVGQSGLDTIGKRVVNTHSGTIDSSWHTLVAFACKETTISSNELLYTVRMNGKRLATFTLTTTGPLTKRGTPTWQLDSITTEAFLPVEYTVTAPADSIVSVNGTQLTAEHAIETDIPTKSNGLLPEGLVSPTMTKYSVSLALGEPNFTSIDKFGKEQAVTSEGNRTYSVPLSSDDALKDTYEEHVINVAKKMANYTSDDLSEGRMIEYTAKNSPARKHVESFNNQWCPTHTGYDFEDMQTSKYYAYSDDCFSVEVTFKYIIHYRKVEDDVYDTVYTMYFTKYRDGYTLYNFTMN